MNEQPRQAHFTPDIATEVVRRVVRDGTVAWSRCAMDHAEAAGLTTADCVQALLGGVSDPAVLKDGQWRYRVHSRRICVVLVFRSDVEFVVVDVWKKYQ